MPTAPPRPAPRPAPRTPTARLRSETVESTRLSLRVRLSQTECLPICPLHGPAPVAPKSLETDGSIPGQRGPAVMPSGADARPRARAGAAVGVTPRRPAPRTCVMPPPSRAQMLAMAVRMASSMSPSAPPMTGWRRLRSRSSASCMRDPLAASPSRKMAASSSCGSAWSTASFMESSRTKSRTFSRSASGRKPCAGSANSAGISVPSKSELSRPPWASPSSMASAMSRYRLRRAKAMLSRPAPLHAIPAS
mmetsp:Transcript_12202/g.41400  ORF Transcript_12202/g.41400 Transcript_12202/m.41400 type:complete len:250 (+) Transcript_12202:2-751(+)